MRIDKETSLTTHPLFFLLKLAQALVQFILEHIVILAFLQIYITTHQALVPKFWVDYGPQQISQSRLHVSFSLILYMYI